MDKRGNKFIINCLGVNKVNMRAGDFLFQISVLKFAGGKMHSVLVTAYVCCCHFRLPFGRSPTNHLVIYIQNKR